MGWNRPSTPLLGSSITAAATTVFWLSVRMTRAAGSICGSEMVNKPNLSLAIQFEQDNEVLTY